MRADGWLKLDKASSHSCASTTKQCASAASSSTRGAQTPCWEIFTALRLFCMSQNHEFEVKLPTENCLSSCVLVRLAVSLVWRLLLKWQSCNCCFLNTAKCSLKRHFKHCFFSFIVIELFSPFYFWEDVSLSKCVFMRVLWYCGSSVCKGFWSW